MMTSSDNIPVPSRSRRLLQSFALGFGISWVSGLIPYLPIFVLILILILRSKIRKEWEDPSILGVFVLGFVTRWILLILLYLHAVSSTTPAVRETSITAFALIIIGPEVGAVYEGGIRERVRRQVQEAQRDLFDGTQPLRETEDGTYYGVGPSGVDHGGRIPYDPTNGIVSEGNIILPSR